MVVNFWKHFSTTIEKQKEYLILLIVIFEIYFEHICVVTNIILNSHILFLAVSSQQQ